jgi:acyl transferase domain-containing protein
VLVVADGDPSGLPGLQRGGCAVAVAGGVNVSVHPNKYLLLAQGKFISGKGRCESFGEGGEGYVPGEGVGAVLLKPLAQAQADGDHIYGVIKAPPSIMAARPTATPCRIRTRRRR